MLEICAASEVEESCAKGFQIKEESILIVRKDGQFYAYKNICPHLGIELNFQPDDFLDLDKAYISCANHGALFMIEDGECISGPCSGQALEALKVEANNGKLFIEL